jgi:hypothetical protein
MPSDAIEEALIAIVRQQSGIDAKALVDAVVKREGIPAPEVQRALQRILERGALHLGPRFQLEAAA